MSFVPSPQFTVAFTIVPSGSEAEMVMMTACPGVVVVDDCVRVTAGGLSVMIMVWVETFVEPLLSVTLSFTE